MCKFLLIQVHGNNSIIIAVSYTHLDVYKRQVEDVTDTLRDWESRASVDWESRYRENDDEWRRRYMERFNASADAITTPERVVEEQKENVSDDGKKRTYEELFEEREG